MLLSRFWYFALAVAGTAALTAFLLTQAAFNRQYDSALTSQLRRDRFEIELMLRMDARARLDAIAPIAAHPDVRSALQAAAGRDDRNAIPAETAQQLAAKLTELNGQLEGLSADMLFAVDREGYIVAHVNGGEPPAGSSLGGFPLVERALAGFIRDDVWVWNDNVYRMAARPVIQQGRYVGAIVHGMRLDDTLASRLSERVGDATVAFFHGERVIGRHMPAVENAATADEVEGKITVALGEEAVTSGGNSAPIPLTETDTSRAVYSLVTGGASHAHVGYAVARPVKRLTAITEIFDQVASQDVTALPWPFLGGGAFLVFLIAMVFVWLERDRPVRRLRRASVAFKNGELSRLDPAAFGGVYRKIAQAMNDGIDNAVANAAETAPRRAADLDEILGPTPDQKDSPQFFGFAQKDAAGDDDIPSVPPAPAPPADRPAAPRPPGPPPAVGPGPMVAPGPNLSPGPRFDAPGLGGPSPTPNVGPGLGAGPVGAGPVGAPRPPGAPPAPPSVPKPPPPAAGGLGRPGGAPPSPGPPAAAPTKPAMPKPGAVVPSPAGPPPAAAGKPAWAKGTMLGMGGTGGMAGGAGPVQGLGPAIGDDDDEEVATTVAPVPKELLESVGAAGASDEQEHFREVYERFIATKRECGEPTTGLTYEKFERTLKKNRDTIVSRHDAKSVRFTVYVKDGKAALKATPVR